MSHTDYDEQYYAELQAQEEEAEEERRYWQRLQDEAHANHEEHCTVELTRAYISIAPDDGGNSYSETWHCPQCDLYEENAIDFDDFLYLRNKGVEVRYG